MIFNSSRSIESICGLEVTQEQLDEYDQEDKKLFEAEVKFRIIFSDVTFFNF